jgi:hypothetical protein
MKIISIETSSGSALLANLNFHPIHPIGGVPAGWGLVLWGRCDRAQTLTVALNTNSDWIADWIPNEKAAIVVFSKKDGLNVGDRVEFDTTVVDALCPKCNSSNYVANGASFLCKDCGRQWKKNSRRQRGRPQQEIPRELVEEIDIITNR